MDTNRTCLKCKKTKAQSDFFKTHTYCRLCVKEQSRDVRRGYKAAAVAYKGGKCVFCGYDTYQGALEFHHKDPTQKDPSFRKFRNQSLNEEYKAELDKCILLCANCHAQHHYDEWTLKNLEWILLQTKIIDKNLFIVGANEKLCSKCHTVKLVDAFYKRTGRADVAGYCKECANKQTILRGREISKKAVIYGGEKCQKCNYKLCIGSLQFHHKDPTQKDLKWSSFKNRSFNDAYKQELDKCILLCANCHREAHSI